MELYTFGEVYIRWDGQIGQPALAPRMLALLVYLAYQQRPQTRTQLCSLFWPAETDQHARGNLRKLLLDTGQACDRYLEISRDAIGLKMEMPLWLDVHDFRRHLQALSQSDSPLFYLDGQQASHVEQALQLYRGDFLATLKQPRSSVFLHWMYGEQSVLQREAIAALQQITRYYIRQGRYAEALQQTKRLVALDPWGEQAHRQLFYLYAQMGQRDEALAHYHGYRKRLKQELQNTPTPAFVTLYEELRAGIMPSLALQPAFINAKQTEISTVSYTAAPLQPVIGRTLLLQKIIEQLRSRTQRLVTLIGMGGVGKTHLARTVAEALKANFPNGVAFVALSAADTQTDEESEVVYARLRDKIAVAVAKALHLRLMQDQSPVFQIVTALRSLEILLIFDQVESMVIGAPFLDELLAAAPGLTILATTRERLGLASEQVIEIVGLTTPPAEAELEVEQYQPSPHAACNALYSTPFAAVQFFVIRARQKQPDFVLDQEALSAITQICRLVGGLPLAIELAAGWVGHYTCKEIADAIANDWRFLATQSRGMPPRHRQIETVLEDSWRTLSTRAAQILAQLVQFEGEFSRTTALTATQATPLEFVALVDKSLVCHKSNGCYELHPLVRQFVRAKLKERRDDKMTR